MTVTLDNFNDQKIYSFQNKRKYNCCLNFTRFTKRRNKNNDNYRDSKINIKTALIKNEVIDDDNEEFNDNNLMRTCHRFKLYKHSSNKIEIYYPYDKKKLDKYDYERDQTFCSLTDLEDMNNEDKRSKFFYYKNKSINDYKSCFEKKNKKTKWFRLREKKKKDYIMEESLKYLNESVCSNYKDANKNNNIDGPSKYTKNCVLNSTVNGIRGFSAWIF
ncbi:conserved Plasmodium protein, unknown function [Plasmodium malariae]|uniref:Uncharacterized protein n=1 Tax=Plasmodium malariae TaxID=5858 RepID=A0A1A8WD20_PLAMA|nr:conserved Plasmodium protein, unknown function [Plasmodium malariae]SBS90762.1 conserved Plasmodium protein, unknown function [Plasmodium malariae]SCP03464.1 conserved Plasmodium protein, unknown function [Plasmodium malariae]